jgi:hypothetical protein
MPYHNQQPIKFKDKRRRTKENTKCHKCKNDFEPDDEIICRGAGSSKPKWFHIKCLVYH